ncbi:HAD family hydrolase [Rhodobacteraceae bacterium D3-12]|nr:HAD family hydrolase [Rhodobacteraceae bacterium D3-12]
MQMLDLDGLIFDKDGTLFEFSASWEDWACGLLMELADNDLGHAETMGDAIGFRLKTKSFAPDSIAITHTVGEIAEALVPLQSRKTEAEIVARMNSGAASAPMAQAVPLAPLLSELRGRGLRIGLATNDAESPARAHLGQAGILEAFDFIAGCDSGYGGKPAPGQLLAFAAAMNLAPERIAMVGDSTHDLDAGRRAGMRTIGVLTGLAQADDLAHLADLVLPDIGHIPPKLLTAR